MQIKFNKSIPPDNHGSFTQEALIKRGWTYDLIKSYLQGFISVYELKKVYTYTYEAVNKAEKFIEERLT